MNRIRNVRLRSADMGHYVVIQTNYDIRNWLVTSEEVKTFRILIKNCRLFWVKMSILIAGIACIAR